MREILKDLLILITAGSLGINSYLIFQFQKNIKNKEITEEKPKKSSLQGITLTLANRPEILKLVEKLQKNHSIKIKSLDWQTIKLEIPYNFQLINTLMKTSYQLKKELINEKVVAKTLEHLIKEDINHLQSRYEKIYKDYMNLYSLLRERGIKIELGTLEETLKNFQKKIFLEKLKYWNSFKKTILNKFEENSLPENISLDLQPFLKKISEFYSDTILKNLLQKYVTLKYYEIQIIADYYFLEKMKFQNFDE
jgi:hypothetical protein